MALLFVYTFSMILTESLINYDTKYYSTFLYKNFKRG